MTNDDTPREALEEALRERSHEDGRKEPPRVPWWMWVIIILSVLPGLMFPWTVSRIAANPLLEWLTWFYPLYVICSALLAWQCYGRRSAMSWIIIVLLWLTHGCFYYLTFGNVQI